MFAFIWFGCVVYSLVGFIKPIWPYRSRRQVLFAGLPVLFIAMVILATVAPSPTSKTTASARDGRSDEVAEQPSESLQAQAEPQAQAKPQTAAAPLSTIAGLTHHHDGRDRRVTYHQPIIRRLERSEVEVGLWTLSADHSDIICFEDGNNAVFFTDADKVYAANGKARQFLDFEDGDGMVNSDDELVQIHGPDRAKHNELISKVIEIGLDLCGQKSMAEISAAVEAASEESVPTEIPQASSAEAAFLHTAFAIRGAELCGLKLEPIAVLHYLQTVGVELEQYEARMDGYLALVSAMIGERPDADFCPLLVWGKFGPDGLGLVSE
ncbi:MAG: hypothetical protein JJ913_14035 [Rhizobiaceae bacterium]|nr:hypothetical protein [Rhizobiaceae bacterium]